MRRRIYFCRRCSSKSKSRSSAAFDDLGFASFVLETACDAKNSEEDRGDDADSGDARADVHGEHRLRRREQIRIFSTVAPAAAVAAEEAAADSAAWCRAAATSGFVVADGGGRGAEHDRALDPGPNFTGTR